MESFGRAVIESLLKDLEEGRKPLLRLKTNKGKPYTLSFGQRGHVRRIAAILAVWKEVILLSQRNQISSKREIYYNNTLLFKDQCTVDRAINTLASTFECRRDQLRVVSTCKGLMYGAMIMRNSDNVMFDCRQKCSSVERPTGMQMEKSPRIVLIVEKEAVFGKLMQVYDEMNVEGLLLITGRGYPCNNTLQFVHWLSETLVDTKFIVMVDYDAYGLCIAYQYRRGSTLINDRSITDCPRLEFGGIRRNQIDQYACDSANDQSRNCITPRAHKVLQGLESKCKVDGECPWPDLFMACREQRTAVFSTEIEAIYSKDPANLIRLVRSMIDSNPGV